MRQSIHPRFQGQVEWLSLRRPVFEKPWISAVQLENVHQVPQKSISWRCLSQDGDAFLFGNIRTEPEVNLYKEIIHNQQESSHSVFSF